MYSLIPRLAPAQGKGESLGTMLTYLPKGFSVEEEVEEWRHVEGGMRCVRRVTCNRKQSLLQDYQQEAYSACTNT